MINNYKTVYQGGEGIVVEKKSRFIATVMPIASEEEAVAFVERMKKKYWDARHNCFAYVLGEHHEIKRYSDDGEPGGTAGMPMLNVLTGEDIHDTAVVVTRYFGGTLLGTGGLVRAYSAAVKEGLASSIVIEKNTGYELFVHTDYNGVGKIQYILGQRGLYTLDSEYTDTVTLKVLVPVTEADTVEKEITEATGARAGLQRERQVCYARIGDEVKIFET